MHGLSKGFCILLLVSIFAGGCQPHNDDRAPEKPVYEATTVAACLAYPIPESDNLIYCSTFQIAWNELKNDIIKADITMEEESPIVGLLNEGMVGTVGEDDHVALAGFGRDRVVEAINSELKRKFAESAPSVEITLEDDEILAYAYLFKNLLFAEEFEELEEPVFFQGSEDADVEVFGIKKFDRELHDAMGKQVRILDYKDDLDFVLELTTTSSNDVMVLAMVEPERTLLETFKAIEERIGTTQPASLEKDDVLKIPKIRFDIDHSYDELLNKMLKNDGFTEYFIARAQQSILFKLDERGALLESEAEIILKKNGSEARYFVFNQPFMLYLKQKGAEYPYLAVWIHHPELLVKAENKE
jgi:hypothetical protein